MAPTTETSSGATATRVLKTACAGLSVFMGAVMILCTVADLFAGVGTLVGAALGLAWAVAGVICGIETWRGPVVLARAIRMASEGRGQ